MPNLRYSITVIWQYLYFAHQGTLPDSQPPSIKRNLFIAQLYNITWVALENKSWQNCQAEVTEKLHSVVFWVSRSGGIPRYAASTLSLGTDQPALTVNSRNKPILV